MIAISMIAIATYFRISLYSVIFLMMGVVLLMSLLFWLFETQHQKKDLQKPLIKDNSYKNNKLYEKIDENIHDLAISYENAKDRDKYQNVVLDDAEKILDDYLFNTFNLDIKSKRAKDLRDYIHKQFIDKSLLKS